jgi:hypothetical protein
MVYIIIPIIVLLLYGIRRLSIYIAEVSQFPDLPSEPEVLITDILSIIIILWYFISFLFDTCRRINSSRHLKVFIWKNVRMEANIPFYPSAYICISYYI